jgi:hypothetical protein
MKKESIRNELRAICSLIRFSLHVKSVARRERKERERVEAGIFTREEQRVNREAWNV